MSFYTIGIDTGGTYTDAVLLETASGRIMASAKMKTTHGQLAVGSGQALQALLEKTGIQAGDINALAVSSTLATNSVVENKGARVALLVIGYVRHFKLPVKAVVYLKGGHTVIGEEEQPLELEYLVEMVSRLKDEVDAFGVCSAMSIKNPAHELVAEKAISMLAPKPVFCSHRASGTAGMKERAATAALHAKLMPVMQEYLTGVQAAMAEHELNCPLFIISGSGDTISGGQAVEFAANTVASGPACTAYFGAMSTREDALVIDVGGTTTDIAMIQKGAPLLAVDGCRIGDWKTHVEAVDMITGGIGGDSLAVISDNTSLQLGPARVVPLSMAANLAPPEQWLGPGDNSKHIHPSPDRLAQEDDEVAAWLLHSGPATPAMIRQATGISGVTLEKKLERMAHRQQILEVGFTPTDALHVLGEISIGNRTAASNGASTLGGLLNMSGEEFSRYIIEKAEEQIETLILDYLVQQTWGNSLTAFLAQRKDHPLLSVGFSLNIPLIGIGAAARHLLPGVAKRLATTVIFPENCEVGNAIGAAMIARNRN